jgi:hypothetical protein
MPDSSSRTSLVRSLRRRFMPANMKQTYETRKRPHWRGFAPCFITYHLWNTGGGMSSSQTTMPDSGIVTSGEISFRRSVAVNSAPNHGSLFCAIQAAIVYPRVVTSLRQSI